MIGMAQQYWEYDLVYDHIHDAIDFVYINVGNSRGIMNHSQ